MTSKKVIFFLFGGYVFTECPACGGSYSLHREDMNKICTPAWCINKKRNPQKDAEKVLREASKDVAIA